VSFADEEKNEVTFAASTCQFVSKRQNIWIVWNQQFHAHIHANLWSLDRGRTIQILQVRYFIFFLKHQNLH